MKSVDQMLHEAEKNAVQKMLCNSDVFTQWLYQHCCNDAPYNKDVMHGKHNKYTKAIAMLLISDVPEITQKYKEELAAMFVKENADWKKELWQQEYENLLEIENDKLKNPDF